MKIAVIGAGINGLYLARKLSEKGHKVIVFEKKEKIGKEVCSGLFSERILKFIPESENLIQNKIDCCLIHFPKRTIKIRFSKPFFVINHYQLDNLAADLAEKAGAKIILNRNILSYDFGICFKRNDRIIGCDGANSFVRKYLDLPEPKFYLGVQKFIKQKDSSDFVETWPTQSGFIWKIPRGKKDDLEYGILEKPNQAKKLFEQFLKKNNLASEKINSGLVPQGKLIIPKNPKITLCGDAAGLTKPWSGGGVIWGLTAADILLKNFPDFLKYEKEMRKIFLPKIILSKIAVKTVYFSGFNFPWLLPQNIKIESDFLGYPFGGKTAQKGF